MTSLPPSKVCTAYVYLWLICIYDLSFRLYLKKPFYSAATKRVYLSVGCHFISYALSSFIWSYKLADPFS